MSARQKSFYVVALLSFLLLDLPVRRQTDLGGEGARWSGIDRVLSGTDSLMGFFGSTAPDMMCCCEKVCPCVCVCTVVDEKCVGMRASA